MKKFLLSLFLGCSFSALAQAEPQPYYFSNELKNAVKNCITYSEDLYEKNPDMKEQASSMMSMFFDRLDLSEAKMILNIQGPQEDKCQIIVKYDYQFPMTQEYECALPQEAQDKLINAMNDKSTETKTRKIGNNGFSMTMTAREFDLTFSEITSSFCKVVEHEPTEEEQAEMEQKAKESMHKMMAFSDKFKNSLKSCTPDKDTIKVMGIDVNEVEIKGKEQGKCHIASHGFHILLNDDELSLSGFDELAELMSDEKRATYRPSYKYQGILFALSECEQKRSYAQGKGTLTLGNIKIHQGVSSSYETGICQVLLSLTIDRDGKSEDHSLRCDVVSAINISSYIKPYTKLIQQYAPKMSIEEGSFSFSMVQQNDEISAADRELLMKMYKAGICKKLNDFPPVNSKGCTNSKPLMGWDDECHTCEETEKIHLRNEDDCEKVCNGTHGRSKRVKKSWDCALESCPNDKPLNDGWGNCYSCDFDAPTDDDNCSLCPNRRVKNGKCVIADCTNRPLVDENGVCYSCNTEEDISMEKGKCTSICPNRVEQGSWSFGDKSGVFCSLRNQ